MNKDIYKSRKKNEYDFLKGYCSDKERILVEKLPIAPESKRRILRSIRQSVLAATDLPETSRSLLSPQSYRIGSLDFSFSYSRFNLRSLSPDPHSWLYKIHQPDIHSSIVFTNGGMAAVYSVLHCLESLVSNHPFELAVASDAYFETHFWMKRQKSICLRDLTCFENPTEVIWFDSISSVFPGYPGSIDSISERIACIDTTCFPLGDRRITDLCSTILSQGNTLLLMRSHTKLDGLGDEYGRLGSILVLTNRFLPKEKAKRISGFIDGLQEFIYRAGLTASLDAIPPFLSDDKASVLNIERCCSIDRHTQELRDIFREMLGNTRVRSFDHNLFICFDMGHTHVKQVEELIQLIIENSQRRDLPLYRAGSFGFDFFALDTYRALEEDRYYLRVAMGDCLDTIHDEVVHILKSSLHP